MKDRAQPCPNAECAGVGQFVVASWTQDSGRTEKRYQDCQRCKGTGAVHYDEQGREHAGPLGFAPDRIQEASRA